MHFLGTRGEGGNNTNSRNRHVQGCGAHENMRDILLSVIMDSMKEKCICWPDQAERNVMSQEAWEKHF